MQIDPYAVGKPHIAQDEIDEVLSFLAALEYLDRRDNEPFGVDIVAVGEIAARERAARVHLMAAAEREEQQLVLVEDRADIAPVGQMRCVSAMIGIVGQEHVAGMNVALEHLDQFLDGIGRPEMLIGQADGNGDGRAVGAPDADGEILQLADQVILRGALHQVPHLLADGLHGVPDRGNGGRIDIDVAHRGLPGLNCASARSFCICPPSRHRRRGPRPWWSFPR